MLSCFRNINLGKNEGMRRRFFEPTSNGKIKKAIRARITGNREAT